MNRHSKPNFLTILLAFIHIFNIGSSGVIPDGLASAVGGTSTPSTKVGNIIFNYAKLPEQEKVPPKSIIFSPLIVRNQPALGKRARVKFLNMANKRLMPDIYPHPLDSRKLNQYTPFNNPITFYDPIGQTSPVNQVTKVTLPGTAVDSKVFAKKNLRKDNASIEQLQDGWQKKNGLYKIQEGISDLSRILSKIRGSFDKNNVKINQIMSRLGNSFDRKGR